MDRSWLSSKPGPVALTPATVRRAKRAAVMYGDFEGVERCEARSGRSRSKVGAGFGQAGGAAAGQGVGEDEEGGFEQDDGRA